MESSNHCDLQVSDLNWWFLLIRGEMNCFYRWQFKEKIAVSQSTSTLFSKRYSLWSSQQPPRQLDNYGKSDNGKQLSGIISNKQFIYGKYCKLNFIASIGLLLVSVSSYQHLLPFLYISLSLRFYLRRDSCFKSALLFIFSWFPQGRVLQRCKQQCFSSFEVCFAVV